MSSGSAAGSLDSGVGGGSLELFRRVTYRIVPFFALAYVVSYLDRVNVGIAKLQMVRDVGLTEETFAWGASIFFWSYMLLEVPSNLILQRVGARVWISRIMISWGVVSTLMALATTAPRFYGLRFLLGVCEAGFFPGVIFYATRWLPSARMGRLTSLFLVALPISVVIGAPLSGAILDGLDGALGLFGWQWLFILEGFPAVVIGLVILYRLDDDIAGADWLSTGEKETLEASLLTEDQDRIHGIGRMVREPRVYALILAIVLFNTSVYGLSFWLPTIIKASSSSLTSFQVGLLTAVPFLCGAVTMPLNAALADRNGAWRWHGAIPPVVAGVALGASAFVAHDLVASVALMTIAVGATMALIPLFWILPTRLLTGSAAAAGLGLINCFGSFSGILGALIIGYAGAKFGICIMAAFLIAYSALFLALSRSTATASATH